MNLLKRYRGIYAQKHLSFKFERHLKNLCDFSRDGCVKVEISGEILKFPYVWLRDNCQCEQCFHQSAKSRIIDWSKFNLDIKPKDVKKEQNTVHVIWEDGHTSIYGVNWLKFRSFRGEHQKHYNDIIYKPPKKTWNENDFVTIFKRYDYNSILKNDSDLSDWLNDLATYGVALIEHTPNSETALDSIIAKVGFTKQTHYGTKFVVENVPNTSNVAYLSSKLQMHVDLPYYEYCPGVNMLHCLTQTSGNGGDNLLSDCHYTAQYMKKHHPKHYILLTETEVEWSDVGVEHGNEFFKLYRSPVISLDKHGDITRINFSIPQRGSHFPGPIETVKPWYEAHGLFYKLNLQFSTKFKSKAGDILVFDNIRLLHGRNEYEDNAGNVRKLVGAYLDWDEIYSRLRCLKAKLNHDMY